MRPVAVPVMIVLDAVLVVVFSTFGRGAHSEGLGVAQVWGTAWPFLVGLAVGWLVLLAGRREPSSIGSGAARRSSSPGSSTRCAKPSWREASGLPTRGCSPSAPSRHSRRSS